MIESQENLSLQRLDDDVLHLILGEAYRDDRSTLCSTSKVSRRFYQLSVPWLYRIVHIKFTSKTYRALFARLQKDGSNLQYFVRKIRLSEYFRSKHEHRRQLVDFLPKLKRVESFWWDDYCDMPCHILDCLQKNWPKAQLTVTAKQVWMSRPNEVQMCKDVLYPVWPSSAHLRTFILTTARDTDFPPDSKRSLFKMLRSSPNLKTLHILDWISYHYGSYPDMSSIFCQGSGDLVQLEELVLKGQIEPILTLRELEVLGLNGGWEKLKILRLNPAKFLPAFIGRVPSLEVLGCDCLLRGAMERFDGSISLAAPLGPLQELDYEDINITLPIEMLQHVSSTLRTVKMHKKKPTIHGFDICYPPGLETHELEKINEACPGLEVLAIDMRWDNEWPWQFLASFAEFRNLTHLTLFVEWPIEIGIEPVVDEVQCMRLFNFVSAQKLGRQFRRLTVEQAMYGMQFGMVPIRHNFACELQLDGSVNVEIYRGQWEIELREKAEDEAALQVKDLKSFSTGRLVCLARQLDAPWTEACLDPDMLAEGDATLEEDFGCNTTHSLEPSSRGILGSFKRDNTPASKIVKENSSKSFGKYFRSISRRRTHSSQVKEATKMPQFPEKLVKDELLGRMLEKRSRKMFPDDVTLYDVLDSDRKCQE
ncbi:hypothetical protein K432DRAFT_142242 [Lepidopterella palustris CBS 459.81]|uniref:F-box domain-containing protein n=1 Tax=Lepidopterella palustris CBS 459.81 TaxID=1314670 RepID=A0A8E2E364_9PEZI|nr:hypothetical protein K432DRAFT_142242 [Lepidopterella palustris CBS 459.81]